MLSVSKTVFAFMSLCSIGGYINCPAAAQDLVYKLSGVKFSDGGTATGYFVYNPTTKAFEDYHIQTTDGSTISSGEKYSPSTKGPKAGGTWVFTGDSFASFTQPYHTLVLATSKIVALPGKYPLTLGTNVTPTSFDGSGECLPATRGVAGGFLVVTTAATH